jgi:hypothetical protein
VTTTLGVVREFSCSSEGILTALVHLPQGDSSFTLTASSTNNYGTSTSGLVSFSRNSFICPTGYVAVPASKSVGLGSPLATAGNSDWTLDVNRDFCVMKYPAKQGTDNNAVSIIASKPWRNLPLFDRLGYTYNMKSACEANGIGYKVMRNMHWQTIARNTESVAANWSGGNVGSGTMSRGIVDGTYYGDAVENSTDDDPFYGAVPEWSQKRTKILSNGETIWDIGGNVWHVMYDDYSSLNIWHNTNDRNYPLEFPYGSSYNCCFAEHKKLFEPSGNFNSTHGVGNISSVSLNGNRVLRGGSELVGPFQLAIENWEVSQRIGFRCVYSP